MSIIKRLLNSFVFWGAWIVISVLMEIVPSLGSIVVLMKRRIQGRKKPEPLTLYPEISIIIPVYHSADTLSNCLRSIYDSTYPNESIRIFLVNNGQDDGSFHVFARCQQEFPELRMQWLSSEQGKSRALNLALYNSGGKYIINLDSDGRLEPNALKNMIEKFEARPDLNCMTGAILTHPDDIKKYKGFFNRLLRNLEFMEYAQAFLAGRSYASETNSVYTLSGAFSAFRKSVVLKSWLYNTETICEDTHITFQMRYRQKERIEICEDAIFYVDPIEGVDKLYTQRQRWQRGSLEVAKMFMDKNFRPTRIFKDVNIRTLLFDHTFAFPRMIWYLAMICMVAMGYSGSVILYATGVIFFLYMLIGLFYFLVVLVFLKMTPDVRDYYRQHWWCVFLLPFFNLFVFFIRMAGIINSISTDSSWKTRTLSEESKAFAQEAGTLCKTPLKWIKCFRSSVNRRPKVKRRQKQEAELLSTRYRFSWYLGTGVVFFLAALVFVAVFWSKRAFGVELNEIMNTLAAGTEGTGAGMIHEILTGAVLPLCVVLSCYVLWALFDSRLGRRIPKRAETPTAARVYHGLHTGLLYLSSVALGCSLLYAGNQYQLLNYLDTQATQSTLYEDYYVSPKDVAITADGKTKNLVYIYVESLETTYADKKNGGVQPVNYMPKLTQLAEENLNFADVDGMGGFHSLPKANWTLAALLTTTSGAPYGLSVQDTAMAAEAEYLPGMTTLGDVLEEKGYNQMFMCGSDSSFAGRAKYFQQHGNYEIFDLFSAREQGYVPPDYKVNWGVEDKVLFDIARDQLTKLSDKGKPFNFTFLTVDLHATKGFMCDWCEDKYEHTANVVACSDRLVASFVEWIQQQDFYKDTVIIITGDHPRMDKYLVDGVSYYERTVYDCVINSDTEPQTDPKRRSFTPMDMLPTTLAALGFDIEGERLGLGVNLFSKEKTLLEEKGMDWLEREVQKDSEYYVRSFAPNLLS